MAIHVLWEAGRQFEQGLQSGILEHDMFNESLMCCLPKQASHITENGDQVYSVASTKPLSIATTDSRLIANAVRIRRGPILGPTITQDQ
eukprot:4165666-Pyramimonas_sp.AAC.1